MSEHTSTQASTFAAALLAIALMLSGCAQRAETTATPQQESQTAAEQEEPVQLEPAYPEDVSAEGLSAADLQHHREREQHSHEDGTTHTHEGEDHHGDGEDDHEHGDDGHSH
jgi:hypothetical protein